MNWRHHGNGGAGNVRFFKYLQELCTTSAVQWLPMSTSSSTLSPKRKLGTRVPLEIESVSPSSLCAVCTPSPFSPVNRSTAMQPLAAARSRSSCGLVAPGKVRRRRPALGAISSLSQRGVQLSDLPQPRYRDHAAACARRCDSAHAECRRAGHRPAFRRTEARRHTGRPRLRQRCSQPRPG